MLQNTAVLKVGGGLVAAGGLCGTGYYANTQGLFNLQHSGGVKESEKNYVIVKSNAHNSDAEGEIYEQNLFLGAKKNFLCSLTVTTGEQAITDKECEIYKLSDEEKKLAKAIKNNNAATTNNIKEVDNYFKITSPVLIKKINKYEHETEQLISVVSIKDEKKIFAKLTPVYKVENGKITERKTSILLAKTTGDNSTNFPTSAATNTTTKNYKCQIESTTEEIDCLVTDWAFNTTNKTSSIDFNNNTTTLTSDNFKTQDKYFAVHIEAKYLEKFDLGATSVTKIIVNPTTKENDKKFAELTPVLKIFDKEVEGKNDFLLLKINSKVTDEQIDSTWNKYSNCKFIGSNKKFSCKVYKFNSKQSNLEKSTINFSGNLALAKQKDDITDNNDAVVIKFDNNEHKDLLKKDAKIQLISTTPGKGVYEFTLKGQLFTEHTEASETLTINAAHILDV